ncbi:uncharacterized protein V1513DRAFT_460418 [Lipomyces chichibuensis]|uniref:uncharacterized protein n=1 Tax=Lipomyces chichibuensis TaxID=1546026 RepID=UPI003342F079
MESTRVLLTIDTFLSRIPPVIDQQVMSPAAPDVSHRFNGKNYKQWAMYMEALHVRRGVWDVVSGMGEYNPAILEDAIQEPGLLLTKDVQHIWKSMKTRYQHSSLVRQLALVNRLFSWKCPNEANPDKWVQEWCDLLKEFLNLQVRQEDFWKVIPFKEAQQDVQLYST